MKRETNPGRAAQRKKGRSEHMKQLPSKHIIQNEESELSEKQREQRIHEKNVDLSQDARITRSEATKGGEQESEQFHARDTIPKTTPNTHPDNNTKTIVIDSASDPLSTEEAKAYLESMTIRHTRFVIASILFPDLSKATAAMVAGYAPKSAESMAHKVGRLSHIRRLLSHIDRQTSELRKGMQSIQDSNMSQDDIKRKLEGIIATETDNRMIISAIDKLAEVNKWIKAGANAKTSDSANMAELLESMGKG